MTAKNHQSRWNARNYRGVILPPSPALIASQRLALRSLGLTLTDTGEVVRFDDPRAPDGR